VPRNFCTSNKGTLLPRPGSNGHFGAPSRLGERFLGIDVRTRDITFHLRWLTSPCTRATLASMVCPPARTWPRIRACMGTRSTLPAFCFRGAAAFAGSALRAFYEVLAERAGPRRPCSSRAVAAARSAVQRRSNSCCWCLCVADAAAGGPEAQSRWLTAARCDEQSCCLPALPD